MSDGLARALRDARESAGYSMGGLAAEIGVGQSHISRVEAGLRNATPDLIDRWFRACGYTQEAVAVGRSPRSADLASAVAEADDQAVEAAIILLRVWKALTARERETLTSDLAIYKRDYLIG